MHERADRSELSLPFLQIVVHMGDAECFGGLRGEDLRIGLHAGVGVPFRAGFEQEERIVDSSPGLRVLAVGGPFGRKPRAAMLGEGYPV